jgi:threonine-phosphate decarboxylase
MASALDRYPVKSYGASMPAKPPVLPFDKHAAIDWHDFSQTLNPLGTPDSFVAAMHVISMNGLGGEDTSQATLELPGLLAKRYGVEPQNIAVSSTATDVLRGIAAAFPRTNVAIPFPVRNSQVKCFEDAGHTVIPISNPDGYVTPDRQSSAVANLNFTSALLSNPGFPTSRLLPRHTLRSYLETCDWVVVDERGIDLTLGGESVVPMIERYPNLIVVQSFTDVYSLPGLPVSCAVASPKAIDAIASHLNGPASPLLANALARLSLENAEALDRTREMLESEIPWLQCMLSLVPGITIFPAEANFVMCSYSPSANMDLGAADLRELVHKLQMRGFLVRTLERTPGIEPNSRFCVSVRKRGENERLIAAMRSIISH